MGKSLCSDPSEDHWTLRDQAAGLIGLIVGCYGSAFVTLQPRLAKVGCVLFVVSVCNLSDQTLSGALLDFGRPLATLYGAVRGLSALGAAATRSLLVPHLALLMPFVQSAQNEGPPARRADAARLLSALIDACVALVKVPSLVVLLAVV